LRPGLTIEVTREASSLGARIVYATIEGVSVSKGNPGIERYLSEVVSQIRKRYALESLKENPVIRAYRDFFWRIGIDPTKTRPSSEALIRRILKGRPVPRINNVVDSGNLASIITLVPIGLYDVAKINGKLLLRMAKEGEKFEPIGSKEEELTGKEPVLADERKVIHLYPHRDSERTKIDENSKEVLVVACGVPKVESSLLLEATNLTLELITRFAGGKIGQEPSWAPTS